MQTCTQFSHPTRPFAMSDQHMHITQACDGVITGKTVALGRRNGGKRSPRRRREGRRAEGGCSALTDAKFIFRSPQNANSLRPTQDLDVQRTGSKSVNFEPSSTEKRCHIFFSVEFSHRPQYAGDETGSTQSSLITTQPDKTDKTLRSGFKQECSEKTIDTLTSQRHPEKIATPQYADCHCHFNATEGIRDQRAGSRPPHTHRERGTEPKRENTRRGATETRAVIGNTLLHLFLHELERDVRILYRWSTIWARLIITCLFERLISNARQPEQEHQEPRTLATSRRCQLEHGDDSAARKRNALQQPDSTELGCCSSKLHFMLYTAIGREHWFDECPGPPAALGC